MIMASAFLHMGDYSLLGIQQFSLLPGVVFTEVDWKTVGKHDACNADVQFLSKEYLFSTVELVLEQHRCFSV